MIQTKTSNDPWNWAEHRNKKNELVQCHPSLKNLLHHKLERIKICRQYLRNIEVDFNLMYGVENWKLLTNQQLFFRTYCKVENLHLIIGESIKINSNSLLHKWDDKFCMSNREVMWRENLRSRLALWSLTHLFAISFNSTLNAIKKHRLLFKDWSFTAHNNFLYLRHIHKIVIRLRSFQ